MLWVTWRQHRAELLTALILLALVAIPVVVSGLAMHTEYQTSGAAACVARPGDGCGPIVDHFVSNHLQWANRLVWVAFFPVLAGMFIGAPLLAREFESGTWRLAFTQGVTRTRWLLTKLTFLVGAVAVVALGFALLFTWWRGPLNEIDGRLRTAAFVVSPASLAAVTVFALAVGVFVGALLRRTIAAMAVTLAAYLVVRIPMEEAVRPAYLTPRSRVTDASTQPDSGWRPTTDWVVDNDWVDGAGRHLTADDQAAIMRELYSGATPMHASELALDRYMAEHGIRHYAEYHPDSSFAAMQLIEAGLYLGMAAVLFTGAAWIVRARTTRT